MRSSVSVVFEAYHKLETRYPKVMEALLSIPVRAARAALRTDHVVVRRFGNVFDLNLRDHTISAKILLGRSHEPMEGLLMRRYVRPGDTVLDIGANIGWFSVLLAQLVGESGSVIAFEPDPTNLDFLNKNLQLNHMRERVTIIPAGAAASSGTATLYRNTEGNYGDQRLGGISDSASGKRTALPVPVVAVDDTLVDGASVSFVKMDIQGHEPFAIDGMARTLQRNDRLIMVTEFWPFGIAAAGRDPKKMLDDLSGYGYQIYELSNYRPELKRTSATELLTRYSRESEYTNIVCSRQSDLTLT